jgi:hypothetical protein
LTASNSLRKTEEGSPKGRDALGRENLCGIQGWASGRDLDAEAIAADAGAGKFAVIQAGMVKGRLEVVGLGGQGLKEDAALDGIDILLAHQDGLSRHVSKACSIKILSIQGTDHARVNGKPSLVLEFLGSLKEHVPVRVISKLNVHPELVASLVMRYNGHALDVFRVHPIDIDVDYVL